MRDSALIFAFVLALSLSSPGVARGADFEKGLDAYNKGDYAIALQEFEPLAERGDAKAQFYLGVIYALGRGVLQNYVRAHMWLNLAASNGYLNAEADRRNVAGAMTPGQIAEARRLAERCQKNDYKECWRDPGAVSRLFAWLRSTFWSVTQSIAVILIWVLMLSPFLALILFLDRFEWWRNSVPGKLTYVALKAWLEGKNVDFLPDRSRADSEIDSQQPELSAEQDPATVQEVTDEGGQDAPKGDETKLDKLQRLARQGDARARYVLGLVYREGEGVPQDHEAAAEWFRLAAEQGDARARYALGLVCRKGEGVPQDHEAATKWFRLAAEQGYARAQHALGMAYRQGKGVLQDHEAAAEWFRLAAEQGRARAQYALGVVHRKGEGVPQDHEAAAEWFRLAAEQGRARAQYALGVVHRKGEGVPQDHEAAAEWFRLAAEQGDARARYVLGLVYREGEGVPQNHETAAEWFRLASEQGYAKAQYNLGNAHRLGKGVSQNHEAALNWYRLAAKQGLSQAQYNLGVMYARGEGVPQNYVYAHMWFNLAASGGDEQSAKARDRVAKRLTPEQIVEAQEHAAKHQEK